jgi:hypothetical protein
MPISLDCPLHNYGPLCRETSRFVNLRGKLFSPGIARGLTNLDVSLHRGRNCFIMCLPIKCFIGYHPCGGKLGCSAGNNGELFPGSANVCQCFIGYLPCGGKLGCSIILLSHD